MAAKLPKTLGATADRLYTLDKDILEIKKKQSDLIERLVKEKNLLENHALTLLAKEKTDTASGKHGRIERRVVTKPTTKDWTKLYKYVKENSAFDLLQRRLNEAAVKERWSEKVTIPGVEPISILKLSILKRTK